MKIHDEIFHVVKTDRALFILSLIHFWGRTLWGRGERARRLSWSARAGGAPPLLSLSNPSLTLKWLYGMIFWSALSSQRNVLRRHCQSIWEGNIFRFISLQKQTGWIASVMILSNCLLKGSFQLSLCLNGQQVSSSISVQYNCHSCKVNLLTFPLHQTEI